MPARSTWRCGDCGCEWPLRSRHCLSDECEIGRRLAEDEEAIPLPALPGNSNDKEK